MQKLFLNLTPLPRDLILLIGEYYGCEVELNLICTLIDDFKYDSPTQRWAYLDNRYLRFEDRSKGLRIITFDRRKMTNGAEVRWKRCHRIKDSGAVRYRIVNANSEHVIAFGGDMYGERNGIYYYSHQGKRTQALPDKAEVIVSRDGEIWVRCEEKGISVIKPFIQVPLSLGINSGVPIPKLIYSIAINRQTIYLITGQVLVLIDRKDPAKQQWIPIGISCYDWQLKIGESYLFIFYQRDNPFHLSDKRWMDERDFSRFVDIYTLTGKYLDSVSVEGTQLLVADDNLFVTLKGRTYREYHVRQLK